MPVDTRHSRPIFAAAHRSMFKGVDVDARSFANMSGWYPILASNNPMKLWWRHLGNKAFSESFFFETLLDQPHEQRQRCVSDFAALDQVSQALPLTALIFHISRCGSTLITQMLSTLPQCVALSEPPVIDSLLHLYQQGHVDKPTCIKVLRGLVRALGQRQSNEQQHLLIKLDCWQLQDLALLREAFPTTPMLFVYREPLQVLASHQRQRGPQMIPGMLDARWVAAPDDLQPGDLDCYCLHVLARFMQVALDAASLGQMQLLNYRELPQAIPERLLQRWGIKSADHDRARMLERSTRHAKHDQPYQGDPHTVTALGAAPDRALINKVAELYEALERHRLKGSKATMLNNKAPDDG